MRDGGRGTRAKGKQSKQSLLSMLFFVIFVISFPGSRASGAEKWPGVDETVVEKIASEHGRNAKPSLIDTDQGDMLLFLFLLAGGAAGFAGGYCWRMLASERKGRAASPETETERKV
jgi:hypothetical protein